MLCPVLVMICRTTSLFTASAQCRSNAVLVATGNPLGA
jgi:hypothetical protein